MQVDSVPEIKYCIMGREVGESGSTLHLQGYCMLEDRISWNKLTRLLGDVHIECPKGTPYQNYVYCSKEKNVIVEIGSRPIDGKSGKSKTDYLEVIRHARSGDLVTLEQEFPRIFFSQRGAIDKLRLEGPKPEWKEKRGLYLVGSPRCGKSRFANTFDDSYIKPPTKWWDGYTNQKVVILEDLDKSNCQGLSWFLKTWMDGYGHSGENKFGGTWLPFETFIVTSNYRIETLYGDDPMLIQALHGRFKVLVVVAHEVSPEGILEIICQDPANPLEIKRFNIYNVFD